MLDLKKIRDNPERLDAALARRRAEPLAAHVLELDSKNREIVTRLQEMQTRRNDISKEIGAKKRAGEDTDDRMNEMAGLKSGIQAAEEEARRLAADLADLLAGIPNIPDDDVPVGADEEANLEIRRIGTPPEFTFAPRDHVDIGQALGMMDFEAAAKLSGSRYVVLSGALARLERALGAFMLDVHTGEYGYTEVYPPLIVRDEAVFGTGQLPKFSEDLFSVSQDGWLIPTAEVSLTNLVADEILAEDSLPRRFTAYTPCFRSEAGAAGSDTRGMIRQHQFGKVELVSITHPDKSDEEHERLTSAAEDILKRLGLAYRVLVLCTGDMGFSAAKTYDLEVWLPGQGRYREISSCSNCRDFQARRMKARFRAEGEKGTHFVHTLNGSGVAVGRALIAILENFQTADGSVRVPEVLVPYMGGLEVIRRDA